MKASEFILLFGRNCRPVDKYDVAIAKMAIFAVKFMLFLVIAFALLLVIIF
ncbi:hypothetical protein [Butyrivibrio sp. YAB3001]|uniref:hypothetical protein n=1 Tax=Butyrivibrio sp. YAB3001 TaxID=1520812 RepID=UPI0008F62DD3|nr:hypothetical protein [Butyrivibrio sp. YAB3001]SFC56413.1 hypothetical protein SAMN02910398_02579 [Butyrivibrio sp. YAB3001]